MRCTYFAEPNFHEILLNTLCQNSLELLVLQFREVKVTMFYLVHQEHLRTGGGCSYALLVHIMSSCACQHECRIQQ